MKSPRNVFSSDLIKRNKMLFPIIMRSSSLAGAFHQKLQYHSPRRKPFQFSRTALSVCIALAAYALPSIGNVAKADPTGGVVVGGSGSITSGELQTIINQTSQNMAIDWETYNVDINETVTYIQPNAQSISLNTVLSADGSTIAGNIESNGTVIIANPYGVIFTETSVVNVGGIVASGLVLNTADFMNGDYVFKDVVDTEGKVINHGLINASVGGNVALIGQQVENTGLIQANLGTVTLAAGNEAVLTFDAGGMLGVRVSSAILQDELGIDPAVINSGDIIAAGGKVLLTASTSQDVFSQAVNAGDYATSVVVHDDGSFTLGGGADVVNSGTIDVSSTDAVVDAGQIVLLGDNVTSSGELLANTDTGEGGHIELQAADTTLLTEQSQTQAIAGESATGGTIKLLGGNVGLIDQASVDASGGNGGQVYVGGGLTGKDDNLPNATFTYIGENTDIAANGIATTINHNVTAINDNATESNENALDDTSTSESEFNAGDAGAVIVFAEDTTRVYGQLSAAGGETSGDGGFVETSGLVGFDLQATPDVTAQNGQGGEWLIDPLNITIIGGDTNTNITKDDADIALPVDTDTLFSGSTTGAQLAVEKILDALDGDATVTITTSEPNDQDSGKSGNISWGAEGAGVTLDFDGTGAGTLNLIAHNNIEFINGSIIDGGSSNDSLNLNLTATNGDITFANGVGVSFEVNTAGGSFTANSETFDSSAIDIVTTGGDNQAGGAITITTTGTGDALKVGALTTNGGSADLNGDNSVNGQKGGDIILTSTGGNITATGAISTVGSAGALEGGIVSGDGGDGGMGGAVTFVALGAINIEQSIITNGGVGIGNGVAEADGGSAGAISIETQGAGSVVIDGILSAVGGIGGGTESSQNDNRPAGGNGGAITITSNDVTINADIDASAAAEVATAEGDNLSAAAGVLTGAVTVDLIGTSAIASFNLAAMTTSNLTINGDGTGTSSASLNIDINDKDSETTESLDWSITDEGEGTASNLSFSAINNLTGGTQDDTFSFTRNDGGSGGSIDGLVDGAGGDNKLVAGNVANEWNSTADNAGDLYTDDGSPIGTNNTFTADNKYATFEKIQNLTGNNAVDTFYIDDAFSEILGGQGDDTFYINKGADLDLINGNNQNDTFYIEGSVDILNGGKRDDTFTITEGASVGQLIGDNGSDTFNIDNLSDVTSIDGGTGINNGNNTDDNNTTDTEYATDVINFTSQGQTVLESQLSNIEVLVGAVVTNEGETTNTNILVGADDTGNIWESSADAAGTLNGMVFENFSNLEGGIGEDEFNIGHEFNNISGHGGSDTFTLYSTGSSESGDYVAGFVTGLISGGTSDSDNDQLVLTARQDSSVEIGATDTSGDNTYINVTGLETLTGNKDQSNTLISTTTANKWVVDTDGNSLTYDTLKLGFSNFTSLVGGEFLDEFEIEKIADVNVNGGTNTNSTLDSLTFGDVGYTLSLASLPNSIANIEKYIALASDAKLIGENLENTWNVTADYIGNVSNGSGDDISTTYFEGFVELEGGTEKNTFNISAMIDDVRGKGKDDTFNLLSGAIVDRAIGNNGADTFNIDANATVTTEVIGGNGADVFNIDMMDQVDSVKGNGGSDIINIKLANQTVELNKITTVEFVNATAADVNDTTAIGSTLAADIGTNDWQITGENSGTLNDSIAFTNFDNLTGNSGADTFTFTVTDAGSGSITGLIDGGEALIAEGATEATEEAITANENTIIANNGNNEWDISGADEGQLYSDDAVAGFTPDNQYASFSNIQNLTGGTGVDAFTFTSSGTVSGLLDGGTSAGSTVVTDTLDITALTGAQTVELGAVASGTAGVTLNVDHIETITASTDNLNTLIGDDTTNTWTLTGTGIGSIRDGEADDVDTTGTTFSGFSSLLGGTGVDEFTAEVLGVVTSVDGGEGSDNFIYSGGSLGTINGGVDTDGSTDVDVITYTQDNESITVGDNMAGIESLVATGADGTLIATDTVNKWLITDQNVGSLISTVTIPGENSGESTEVKSEIDFAGFENLTGGTLADTFTLSSAGELDAGGYTAGFVTGLINGGAGVGDSLELTASQGYTVEIGDTDTSITVEDTTGTHLNVSGLEALTGNDVQSNTLVSTTTVNDWVINTSGNSLTYDGTLVTLVNFTSLVGGTELDTFTVDNLAGINIDGGTNSDATDKDSLSFDNAEQEINLSNLSSTIGIEKFIATANDATLVAGNNQNTWTVSGANAGSVLDAGENGAEDTSDDSVTEFEGFANLTGGDDVDNFTFTVTEMSAGVDASTGSITGLIDGGTGAGITDTLDITALTDAQTVELGAVASGTAGVTLNVDHIETIDASVIANVNNALIGDDATNTWTLTGTGIGSIRDGEADDVDTTGTTFSGFSSLLGGTGVDEFTAEVLGVVTSVDGGEGSDNFIYSGGSLGTINGGVDTDGSTDVDVITYTQDNESITVGDNMAGIESLVATGADGTLIATDTVNKWLITDQNVGSLISTVTIPGENSGESTEVKSEIDFAGFENLTGGTLADTFTLSSAGELDAGGYTAGFVTGLINGGAGVGDSLELTASQGYTVEIGDTDTSITVEDTTGTHLNVSGLEALTGNDVQSNTLVSTTTVNDWVINTSGNSLTYDGTLVTLVNFTSLVGGTELDTFTVDNLAGINIDGGTNSDAD